LFCFKGLTVIRFKGAVYVTGNEEATIPGGQPFSQSGSAIKGESNDSPKKEEFYEGK
jgi:hypothetical protein